jgi:DNA-directed RNA polymerase subunit omega
MEHDPFIESKYRTVHVAARRARQLQAGAIPLVQPRSRKACKVAQDELRAGKVDYVIPEDPAPKELDLPTGYTPILHG